MVGTTQKYHFFDAAPKQKTLAETSYKGRSKIHQVTFEQISRIHYDMYNFFRFTDPQNFSSRHYICV